MADQEVLQQGELQASVAPLTRQTLVLPFKKPAIKPGAKYCLMVSSKLRSDEIWAKAGHEVSWNQFPLAWSLPAEEASTSKAASIRSNSDDEVVIAGDGFQYIFNRSQAMLTSMKVDGKELLKTGLKMNVWRAPLANEQDSWNAFRARSRTRKPGYGNQVAANFYIAGIDRLTHVPVTLEAKEANGKVVMTIQDAYLTYGHQDEPLQDGVPVNGFSNEYKVVIDGNGKITIKHTFKPNGNMPLWLPRVGMTMVLDNDLDQVQWLGRGPQENYPDRKTGYPVGLYKTTVADMIEPYLVPQDYGLRTDNQYVRMTDTQGVGLEFSSDDLFNFNAYPYSTENLTKAMYTYQLQPADGITLNLDYESSGVGCTALSIFEAYRVPVKAYTRTLIIKPIDTH
jgi:beta-galactosidase